MKRIVSILVSLIMGLSCAVCFIGCTTKKPLDNSSGIEDSAGDSSSGATEDPSKVIDEYLPVVQRLISNVENISVAEIKNADGDVLSLIFSDITVGNIFKNVMEYTAQDGSTLFVLNRYKDGKWRCGTKATEIDSDLNAIFEYRLFSGPLDIAADHLEIVRDKKVVDLLVESLLNTKFSIKATLDMLENQAEGETDVGGIGSAMLLPYFSALTENKAVYEFVKPLLLLSVGDFYDITLDNGVTYIKNTYGALDVDTYIGLAAYVLNEVEPGDYDSATKLLCDLVDGSIAEPVLNGELEISELVDDIVELIGFSDSNVIALVKNSIAGTISEPKFVAFDTVDNLTSNVCSLLTIFGVDEAQVLTVKNFLGDLLVDSIMGVTINRNQKIITLIEYLDLDEETKNILREQLGDMTIGDLLAAPKEFCDKIESAIAAIKEKAAADAEILEKLYAIAEKYIYAEDISSIKLMDVCQDLMNACRLVVSDEVGQKTDLAFMAVMMLVNDLLPEDVTLGNTPSAVADVELSALINEVGMLSAFYLDSATDAKVKAVLDLISMSAGGKLGSLQFNAELTVVQVINQVKTILSAFGVENELATKILNKLSVWYEDTLVTDLFETTMALDIDEVINAACAFAKYVLATHYAEDIDFTRLVLTTLLDGKLSEPQLNQDAINMTVAEFLNSLGGESYFERIPELNDFADFTISELLNYRFGTNDEIDEVIINLLKEKILSYLSFAEGDINELLAA